MIVLGAAIAFCAALGNALALVLQSAEARDAPEGDARNSLSLVLGLVRRPRWVIGTGLLIAGWPLQLIALTYAPLTVVQPALASFQLILLGLARYTLKEPVGRRELAAAGLMVIGVVIVLVTAPHRSVLDPSSGRLAVPIILVAAGALALYARAQLQPGRHGFDLTLAAGLGYAWVDFIDKMVSNDFSAHRVLLGIVWLAAALGIGTVAFVSEQGALTTRPASQVGPLVGSIQEPLPVVLALWGGLEVWQGGVGRGVALVAGLLLVCGGATIIARSPALAAFHDAGAARVEAGPEEP